MKYIFIIFISLSSFVGFSQSDKNYSINVDSENGINSVFIKNDICGHTDTILIGGGLYEEIIQFYIENPKSASFLSRSNGDLISYIWMKKKNGDWRVVAEKNFFTLVSTISNEEQAALDNGEFYHIPFAYYIEDVNKLTLVYSNIYGERFKEKLEFEDIK